MKNKRNWIVGAAVVLILAAGSRFFSRSGEHVVYKEVKPAAGDIQKFVSATATVQPQNRLEIKPPVGGRVEKILVEEGQKVKVGQVLAVMSSTERAALLDAARPEGEESVKYWEDVYKPIPLISPIDGEVIVRTLQPGQTVTTADPIVVLSDRLIVEAQIDETDIGGIQEGQKAMITLDAYPDVVVQAKVGHIYHESKIVNNVTIYQADVIPDEVPQVFRSGMSANVRILTASREHVLCAPLEAVKRGARGSFVWVKKGGRGKAQKAEVTLGLQDDANAEILSGIGPEDVIVIQSAKYSPSKGAKTGGSPFMPFGRQQQRRDQSSSK